MAHQRKEYEDIYKIEVLYDTLKLYRYPMKSVLADVP